MLCDVNNVRATIGWRNFLLTNQTDSCGSSLSGKVYKEARHLGVGHCCYKMGGIFGKVKEEDSEIDVYDISFKEEASTSQERKTNNSDQSTGLDPEKVRLPYSCSSSSSPTRDSPCPCLAQNTSPTHTCSLKVLLPILLH